MTLSGTAHYVQNTTKVSGGVRSRPTSTSYITLFRVEGRQCMITTSKPIPIADGDAVVVSGRAGRSGLTAYAIHNTANGITSHTGIASKVLLGLILPAFGLIFCGIASMILGSYSWYLYLAFVAYSIYLFYQACMAASARGQVAAHSP